MRTLNTLALGDEYAQQLGVRVESARVWIILIGSLLTAVAVSLGGMISFAGLIVPHVGRLLLGPDHVRLLPVTALGGAIFLMLADTLARTVLAPAEVPVGILMAFIGGAFLSLPAAQDEAELHRMSPLLQPLPNLLLRVNGVHFDYADKSVLRQVSFDLEEGSCSALIGTNGVGKTTLLRIAAGVLRPSAGSIKLNGRAMETMALKEVAQTTALVPQQLELPFAFTVQQVVEQGRTPYIPMLRGPSKRDRLAVERALDLADVSSLRTASSTN